MKTLLFLLLSSQFAYANETPATAGFDLDALRRLQQTTSLSQDHIARNGGVGNGGDAIVCDDGRVMLLDSYEASKMRLTLDLSDENVKTPTLRSMVIVAVKRLQKRDEITASLLYDYAMEMVNDFEKFEINPNARGQHVYLGDDVLVKINDSLHVSTPSGCDENPHQMVNQKKPKFKFEYRYEVNKPLWDALTLQDQAMTVLHEAWYRIMIENGATDSRATRYINALVASKEFELLSFSEYFEEIKSTELKKYFIPNKSAVIDKDFIEVDLKNHPVEIGVDGIVCASDFKLKMRIKETYTLFNRTQRYIGKVKFKKLCFENSKLIELEVPKRLTGKLNGKYTLRLPSFQAPIDTVSENGKIIFQENGKLSHFENITFKEAQPMFYTCNGVKEDRQLGGCKGPFIDKPNVISYPSEIRFDQNEDVIITP